MSAGFEVKDKVFWGTNGAVEAYLEVMAGEAADQLGPDDLLAVFLRSEREQFFMGQVVSLDAWTTDPSRRGQLLALLDAATRQLLSSGPFNDYSKEWIASVIGELHTHIANAGGQGRDTF